MVLHIPNDLLHKRIAIAMIGGQLRGLLRQRHYGVRTFRELRARRHTVFFEGNPIGPQITKVGSNHLNCHGLRKLDRFFVVETLLSQQHNISNGIVYQVALDKLWPVTLPATKLR